MDILFQTVHGSHLYGLDHKDSDHDIFTVIRDNPTIKGTWVKQHISNDVPPRDEVICDFTTFSLYASRGVPQFLEAMWSPVPVHDMIEDYRNSFNPDYYNTVATYQRTIRNFYAQPEFKKKRHAYRMTMNLIDFVEFGRFNPRLGSAELYRLNDMMGNDLGPESYLERHDTKTSSV